MLRTAAHRLYTNVLYTGTKPIVFATGPAGTGKTKIACDYAIHAIKSREFDRLVITRPVHGVDEDLGFLPGDIGDKMKPWMLPITDELGSHYRNTELAPLAYMRGRTFKNSLILADEMQNSTTEQMKMLLTRLGDNSRMIVTGDLRQTDREVSGLKAAVDILPRNMEYIDFVELGNEDILRHEAVKEILRYWV